ncbi:unnamed protein product [Peniophora sp. CBMAI 1063]|nr:unnamed protein product [Peniophora sp. CBMAI 1063]
MRFRLERPAVFQTDYVDVSTGKAAYTLTAHHATRFTTLDLVKHSENRFSQIASICCRELLADTIELTDIELLATVPTITRAGESYAEIIGERTTIKAKKYVRKEGKRIWTIRTPTAATFIWTADDRELILRTSDGIEVAYLRPPKYGDDPATGFHTIFHIEDDVLADMDQIIVSGTYLKYKMDHSGSTASVQNTYMPAVAVSASGLVHTSSAAPSQS